MGDTLGLLVSLFWIGFSILSNDIVGFKIGLFSMALMSFVFFLKEKVNARLKRSYK